MSLGSKVNKSASRLSPDDELSLRLSESRLFIRWRCIEEASVGKSYTDPHGEGVGEDEALSVGQIKLIKPK